MERIENAGGKAGKLYGLGVGPGDPELMTLKAVRLIRESHVIAVPVSGQESITALEIAEGAVPEIREKEMLQIPMPMTRDKAKLAESHDRAAEAVAGELAKGKDVAFLTLGDPSIYSTYLYIYERVAALGFETEIVPGVPSFCAVAARLNEGLAEASEALHIIPASYDGIEEALALKSTRVLMKSGKAIRKVKSILANMDNPPKVKMVERCGMKGERIFRRLEDLDGEAGYFSILVVKD